MARTSTLVSNTASGLGRLVVADGGVDLGIGQADRWIDGVGCPEREQPVECLSRNLASAARALPP
jgi:hypothetical protein